MATYFKLEAKINEVKKFAEIGLSDLKSCGIASLEGNLSVKKGYPVFIAGSPHAGKTEFTFELLINWSILHKWKHFVYCGEGGNGQGMGSYKEQSSEQLAWSLFLALRNFLTLF